MSDSVHVWSEPRIIPTYEIGEENPNPMFLEKRVYQGSSGVVYPQPVIERIAHEPVDKEWTAVFLENEYLRLMILPELGGRLQEAVDKTNDYPFVYRNRVIKPALVGLAGPWISGGIEFNWPQHHRPSTYRAVDWTLEEHEDGSCTVWCSELERMFRTRGRHGFTVYPGRSGFDVKVQLHNRTSEPQTFLWWANPAVHVNDDYQSVFPPDVHAVMDHGKRDVSDFPVATGTYYKQDYSPGTDISRYKNIPVPTSYMAYHSDYDFVGCYDHSVQAGMLHVANHHLVPGKKQWTWGNGAFGKAWDRQLTDEDGPYIELMCGAFTDNQPDFTWLQPGEEKQFTQTFMPYKGVGPASNASRDWVVHLEVDNGLANLGVYAAVSGVCTLKLWKNSAERPGFHNHKNMELRHIDRPVSEAAILLLEEKIELDTTQVWQKEQACSCNDWELTLELLDVEGNVILSLSPPNPEERPEIPSPATAAQRPEEIHSVEELFLNGQHLEQYRHATYDPQPYYEEALRRDPGDSRSNTAMGLLLMRKGRFTESEPFFRTAIDRLISRNPNPYDGEPYYHLGVCLRFQERFDEAFDVFYKAAWSEAWKSPAYFELARIAVLRRHFDDALFLLDQSLARNTRHQKARHLSVAVLRICGQHNKAIEKLKPYIHEDPLDQGLLYEAERLEVDVPQSNLPNQAYNSLEAGLDYLHAGLYADADELFFRAETNEFLAAYYRGWAEVRQGNLDNAEKRFRSASEQAFEYAFPNQLECLPALIQALKINPKDALAAYALGNFHYARREHEKAIQCWEICTKNRPDFPTAWRNLGLAYMNKRQDAERAGEALRKAWEMDPADARILYELDQFDKETAASIETRVNRLDNARDLVMHRDDLCVEYLRLLNLSGRMQEAIEILENRRFQPWEGGEGKTTSQYVRSLILLAEKAGEEGNVQEAKARLEQAGQYPENLGEGKLEAATDNERWLRLGEVMEQMGDPSSAKTCFERATQGDSTPAGALYYNDQPPENIYFQACAWRKLGEQEKAKEIFQRLVDYAQEHHDDPVEMDYFAVSLPDFLVFDVDLTIRNQQHCLFMECLGRNGLKEHQKSKNLKTRLLKEIPDHPVQWLV